MNQAFLITSLFLIISLIGNGILLYRIKNFREKFRQEKTNRIVLESQTDLLEEHINPHFFFNTINTMYGYALKTSKKLPDLISAFSSIMEYSLYNVSKDQVHLSEELSYIQKYIEISMMRFEMDICFKASNGVLESYYPILPNVFIPLAICIIEIDSQCEKPRPINIICTENEKVVELQVTCDFDDNQQSTFANHNKIKSLKNRLKVKYANEYSLLFESNIDKFIASLKIFKS